MALVEATAALGISIDSLGRISVVESALDNLDETLQQQYAAIKLNAEQIAANRRSFELISRRMRLFEARLDKAEYRALLTPHFAALVEEKLQVTFVILQSSIFVNKQLLSHL